MTTRDHGTTYGSISRLNHWIGALFVLLLLGIGLYFGDMARGPEKTFWKGLHVAIGAIAILFLLFRVFWRVRSGFPSAAPQARPLQLLSKTVHVLLLVAIVVLVVTGPLSVWSVGRPIGIFEFVQIPSPFPLFKDWHEPLEEIHEYASTALMYLAGLHVLGMLKHQFIDRDNLLARMTGRRK
ncbi:cytochrome b [Massilia glaciei]|uniref:Cytochrome b n=1 Tax=Massilia glaciei TaxID=1524097 RepID=A0A2U2HP09_9BURK|nr:cytochrome b/b6 domain-containing protein [Massilia glaciei]PWF49192.1 cytochrome b [Massilia glaciei]